MWSLKGETRDLRRIGRLCGYSAHPWDKWKALDHWTKEESNKGGDQNAAPNSQKSVCKQQLWHILTLHVELTEVEREN
jgi:hypothetical protein